ncbi:MAG: 3-deoxy-D-manno-octulosonic acid transferase, partial [Bacillota bacterium]
QAGVKKDKIRVTGNLKFSGVEHKLSAAEINELRLNLGLKKTDKVLVAGSTHPGEEEILSKVLQKVQQKINDFVLIVAPRHVERSSEIKELFAHSGLQVVRKSKRQDRDQQDVIILDTVGELADIYSLATVTFVGGTFVRKGGHNFLEPAIYGKPVLFGPHDFNFKQLTEILLDYQVGIKLQNEDEFIQEVISLIEDRERLSSIAEKARQMFKEHQGALDKNIDLIEQLLR